MEFIEAKNAYSAFTGFEFRAGQREAIEYCYNSIKPVTILRAPVGSGKTLVGLTLGQMYSKFAYLCSSKQLQDQIERDHGSDIALLMGRSNYPCALSPNLTAANCVHSKDTPCVAINACAYRRQKEHVIRSRRQVLNYNYMLTEFNYVGAMRNGEDYPIMIADEADVLDNMLTSFVCLTIPKRSMGYYGINQPPRKAFSETSMGAWKLWADDSLKQVNTKLSEVDRSLEYAGEVDSSDAIELQREKQKLSSMAGSFKLFLDHADKTWIANESDYAYEFKPLWLTNELAYKYYWSHANKHVLMSGTWPPLDVIARTLGLHKGDIDMIEVASTFPAKACPVRMINAADMSFKQIGVGLPKMLDKIKHLLTHHSSHKGIIHTSNYAITQAIMELGDPRLITHSPSNKADMVERFKDSPKPLVFVSPSSTRGIDLPDDHCRFNILAKAPYPSLSDKFISARSYTKPLGQQWYTSLCAQEIEQAFGRGMRHEQDWCECYSLDTCANRLMCGQPSMFSEHFLSSRAIG